MAALPTSDSTMPPFHRQIRWRVLALLFLVTVINFVDRQTLSNLAPDVTREFHLSNTAFSTIPAAFRFGMMMGGGGTEEVCFFLHAGRTRTITARHKHADLSKRLLCIRGFGAAVRDRLRQPPRKRETAIETPFLFLLRL